jgi:DNA-binding response OmpR family regulator
MMRQPGSWILVADADEAFRSSVADALRQAGYAAREVASGPEAAEIVRSEPPRLAILDVALPGICGYQLCSDLRSFFGQSVPIIFVSGERTEPFDRVAGLLLGADDYLVKPSSVCTARPRPSRSRTGG